MDKLNEAVEDNESEIVPKLRDKQAVSPQVWKPGVVWDGDIGEITTKPSSTPHYDDILTSWGYDAEHFQLIDPVKVSTWEVQTKEGTEQLWSYKAGIRKKEPVDIISYNDLMKSIKKHRPLKEDLPGGDTWLIVNISDTQFGKGDGDGLAGTIERFYKATDGIEQHIKNLRKSGVKLGHLLVVGLGDIIESCTGQYASQAFTVELNRREQIRVARRLIRDAIARWSKLFVDVKVSAVVGNHGEARLDGKMFTERGDNDDVAVFEILAEVFAANPKAYGHIKFHLPKNEIYVMFDCDSTIVGFTHGHITKGGSSPQQKIRDWWEAQAFGEQPIGDASILLTGHYHHTSLIQYGKKVHIQCPALDGGSNWFKELSGAESPPGMLTLTVDRNGWDNLKIF